jgi:hypothetical protein
LERDQVLSGKRSSPLRKEIKSSQERDQVLLEKRSSPLRKEIKSSWKRDQVLLEKRSSTLGETKPPRLITKTHTGSLDKRL